MASFNRVILVGNLTRDVELRTTPGGTAVTDVGLAVNDRVKKNNEWVDETTFVDVTIWGSIAEVASQYLSKGSPVLIEGRLKLERWEDSQTGANRQKLKVVCEKMQMLGTGKGGNNGSTGNAGDARPQQNQAPAGAPSGNRASNYAPPAPEDDDIPF